MLTAAPAPTTTPDLPWPGRPAPLGARWDGAGTGFAVVSSTATAVWLCLFDGSGTERQVPLVDRTGDVWHGYLPGVGPGQEYGYRVEGPYDPVAGLRHNARKLLVDPYARAITGGYRLDDSVLGSPAGRDRLPDQRDSAPHVPRSVVVDDAYDWGDDRPPSTDLADSVVYELHVKGFTAQHPGVPEELRGTYAGLAHPAAVEHLVGLGVTAVELLPVHQFVSEPHLLRRGLTNHWGYNTLGYFAPHAGYSSSGSRGEQVTEFRSMVRALHAAGLEVLVDVVYNHTGEGDHEGPTLSLRGLDNVGYYRLQDGDRSLYRDYTGCGNSLDLRHPYALQLVLDSLRYWVTELHVDGFRFDLASTLGRTAHAFDPGSPFLQAVHQDPVLSTVKLIAEPWDLGEGGYQVGGFPHPWAEWNDRYRDTVRDTWRGAAGGVRGLAYRLSGSSDLYAPAGRSPAASINFVTAHDGFTLRDLTTYERKHNEANGEGNRDGDAHNRSWACGVEGETADPEVNALRRRQARNLLSTLLLSSGVPMLSMGDEVRRTQSGNNNAYCQDGPLSWQPWDLTPDARDLRDVVAQLIALRREHPVLRRRAFFTGRADADGVKDVAWFGASGREHTETEWFDQQQSTLGMYVDGRQLRTRGPQGEPVVGESLLLLLHTGAEDGDVVLPAAPWATSYELLLDTAAERPVPASTLPAGGVLRMTGRSTALLRAVRP